MLSRTSVSVVWMKNSQNGQWFDLLRLNLDSSYFENKEGVYVIWYTNSTAAKVIRIGQGLIGMRLREHKSNPQVRQYENFGALKATWAVADGVQLTKNELDGVENFLADTYNPIIGERFPEVLPISVNLIE